MDATAVVRKFNNISSDITPNKNRRAKQLLRVSKRTVAKNYLYLDIFVYYGIRTYFVVRPELLQFIIIRKCQI